MPQTVRIDPAAHAALVEIARAKHIPRTEALSRAVELYRREVFLEGLADDFAALRADAGAWAEEQAEREVWDVTNADGLADE
jgi:predicted transcriptional regulator